MSILFFSIALPVSVFAWILFGVPGFFGGLIFSAVFFVALGLRLEKTVAKALGAKNQLPLGLNETLLRTFKNLENAPRFFCFLSSEPRIVIAKNIVGKGAVLISQGYLETQPEERLRQELKQARENLNQIVSVHKTFCGVGLHWLGMGKPIRAGIFWWMVRYPAVYWLFSLGRFKREHGLIPFATSMPFDYLRTP